MIIQVNRSAPGVIRLMRMTPGGEWEIWREIPSDALVYAPPMARAMPAHAVSDTLLLTALLREQRGEGG